MIEIAGRLIFDSWASRLPEIRGDFADRHLIYETQGIVLDLVLRRAAKGEELQIVGQVMPGDSTRATVSHVDVLMESGNEHLQVKTNALGEFSFATTTPGACIDLSISLDSRRFVVRGLESVLPAEWHVTAAGLLEAGQ